MKTYMVFDLFILTAIGFVLEVFAIKFGAVVFNGTPLSAFSLLVVFVAVVRWNWWGLLTVPFMALATILGGINIDYYYYYRMVYDWRLFLSLVLGLSVIGFNSIIFKKFKTKRILNNLGLFLSIIVLDYVLMWLVQAGSYALMTIGAGDMTVVVQVGESTKEYSIRWFAESGIVYNLFGLAVLVIGSFILRSQGVLVNAKEKLIDDKKNAELDRQFEKFSIEESESEDDSGETSSPEDKEA